MNELINKIQDDRKQAMKNKEAAKLSTLRLLVSKLENEKVELKLSDVSKLKDEQVEDVIRRNIKELDKEISAYIEVGRLATSQLAEKELLLSYLPTQLTEEEIKPIIQKIVEQIVFSGGNFGLVMSQASSQLKGKTTDMSRVSAIAQEMFKKAKA